ncbi:transferrin-like [Venturia canescens]|uniref:transferrin-like n=1 Tax=Venturia canescens TaxID=32260 RepID=UPI001C9C790D|nr:transferrin-like [Venturia canescens]
MYRFALILLAIRSVASFDEKYKLCAPETILNTTCNSLTRGPSKVSCLRVTDSAECAMRLAEGKADFGVFDAEEMLLAYQFYPDQLKVVSQLRHNERIEEDFEFQSVVVVPASFDARNGLEGLRNGGLCHPGFSDTQLWNDRVMKFFEKRVVAPDCRGWNRTAAENEIENLKGFFGQGCRPGEWVADDEEDRRLKSSHHELCELCDDTDNCKYHNSAHHGHFGALECLVSARGKVAYVAYEYVRQFFGLRSNFSLSPLAIPLGFQFLCEDGTTRPLTSDDPCGWIRQPWSAIVARSEKADRIMEGLKDWLSDASDMRAPVDWTTVLKTILTSDSKPGFFPSPLTLRRYLTEGRTVNLPKNNPCAKKIRWCTVNQAETNKCNWIAMEAILGLDLAPNIECIMAPSTLECLRNIANNEADIITIDSNYGYIARKVFNLTSVMYAETDSDRNSRVVALVREDGNRVKSFQDLKKRPACFPEYAGIAWLSFVNTARKNKIIGDSCDFPKLLSQYFSGACTPGIKDFEHSKILPTEDITTILCSRCPLEQHSNETCSANFDNRYYADKGALRCLAEGAGEIAFVETKNLYGEVDGTIIKPHEYRVLCKNGSLAMYTGFEVDEPCALSVTIDSEVIGRKENSVKSTTQVLGEDVTLALLKLENWLGYRPDAHRPIRIYDSFTGSSNLLFKDSTVGLVLASSQIKSVVAYKELYNDVEMCSGVEKTVTNSFAIFSVLSIYFARVLLI